MFCVSSLYLVDQEFFIFKLISLQMFSAFIKFIYLKPINNKNKAKLLQKKQCIKNNVLYM